MKNVAIVSNFFCSFTLFVAVLGFALVDSAHAAVVTTTNDSGAGSLRQAVANAIADEVITFDAGLSRQTILLTSGQIMLANTNLTIDASALPGGIQINGNANGRIFQVGYFHTVVLDSLTITNGKVTGSGFAGSGGGIYNDGKLTVNRCTVAGNAAATYGGGIGCYNFSLTVNQCTFTGNSCEGVGGAAIDTGNFVTVNVNQSTVTANSTTNGNGSGGIYQFSATVTINNSVVAGNTAPNTPNLRGTIGATGVNLTSGTPLLAPLGYYGGPTPTMPPLPGSPVIDACTSGSAFATDQRGFPRVVGAFADIGAVEGVYDPPGPVTLTGVTKLDDGSVRFGFTSYGGTIYTVLANTNVTAPLNTWSNLGLATESTAGRFQFTDLQATNYPDRYYRVTTP